MNILDWVIIIWLVIAFFTGARTGFVFWAGTVLGLIVGVYVAGNYYDTIAAWLGNTGWSDLGVFLLALVVITALGGIGAQVLNKAFDFIRWLPFLTTANRVLGGLLAVIVNVLLLSVVIFFASHIEISSVVTQTIAESRLAALLLVVSLVVSWILPSTITDISRLF